ncbi:DUF302 domain-containing protein [Pontibaca salina]|uniref:DUF302 domain-containing protein n=1 Tax=Pontibaca salina TaxID=2795731 RepID=A0A934HPM7_9RHOB|nr:DUF302 domain-containing protein [Pontibaca salina]MBI6628656.1 DUF302 domain-containing protein [Pontibaca salina]
MKITRLGLVLGLLIPTGFAMADAIEEREGWVVRPTEKTYSELVEAVKGATHANQMGVVTEAGPTQAAAGRGITIPGNRVIGVFNNDFAVKILNLSTAAMIEAPIRIYITENPDETATLSYKSPSHVLGPYLDEGGQPLADLAAALDDKFGQIADAAVK